MLSEFGFCYYFGIENGRFGISEVDFFILRLKSFWELVISQAFESVFFNLLGIIFT